MNINRVKSYKTGDIANNLLIGKNTAKRELNLLWNIGLVNKEEREEGNRWLPTEYCTINLKNDFITKYLSFILEINKEKADGRSNHKYI